MCVCVCVCVHVCIGVCVCMHVCVCMCVCVSILGGGQCIVCFDVFVIVCSEYEMYGLCGLECWDKLVIGTQSPLSLSLISHIVSVDRKNNH